jgi:hypothetical protein
MTRFSRSRKSFPKVKIYPFSSKYIFLDFGRRKPTQREIIKEAEKLKEADEPKAVEIPIEDVQTEVPEESRKKKKSKSKRSKKESKKLKEIIKDEIGDNSDITIEVIELSDTPGLENYGAKLPTRPPDMSLEDYSNVLARVVKVPSSFVLLLTIN